MEYNNLYPGGRIKIHSTFEEAVEHAESDLIAIIKIVNDKIVEVVSNEELLE